MVQSTSLATAARYEEDTPAASGDKGVLILAVRNDAGGTLVDASGDYAPLQVNVNGELVVGGSGGAALVAVVTIQETPPTHATKNNPSFVFTYTNGDLTGIAMTIGVTTYNRTLAYTNGDLTSMTVWS